MGHVVLHKRLIVLVLIFLVYILLPLDCVIAQNSNDGDNSGSETRLNIRLVLQQNGIAKAGDTIGLAVVMDLMDNWHIYPGKDSDDELPGYIATEMVLNLPNGWKAGAVQWPKAHDFLFGPQGYEEQLKVYEGRAIAYVPLTVGDEVEAGTYEIHTKIKYQACDDQICEMPASAVSVVNVNVVKSDVVEIDKSELVMSLEDVELFKNYQAPETNIETNVNDDAVTPRRVKVTLIPQQQTVLAGTHIGLAIVMDLEENWHIYPGKGSGDYAMYPTEIYFDLPTGWKTSAIQWPVANTMMFGPENMQEEVLIYEGKAIAYVGLFVPENEKAGDFTLKAGVHYQACDDEVCEMPITVWDTVDINVSHNALMDNPKINPELQVIFAEFDKTKTFSDQDTTKGADDDNRQTSNDVSSKSTGEILEFARWWLTFAIICLAMLWMVGKTFGITAKAGYRIMVVVIGVISVWISFSVTRSMTAESEIEWIPYSHAEFEKVLAQGDKTIVIECTAEWCLNCKTLEKTTLSNQEVIQALADPNVVTFRVDLTGENPEGSAKKDEFGKGGIPLTLVYLPGVVNIDDVIQLRGNYTPNLLLEALRGESLQSDKDKQVFDFLWFQFSMGATSWIPILLLACIAGFLMNLTPCVLPVIPIKILSLQAHAKDPKKCFAMGLVFGLGMIAFFAILGILIFGLIGGMQKMDWGDIWKHWYITGPVGLLIGVMGIGMLGMFTMRLPNFVYMFNPQSDSYTGSFLMGVFAAILSTPCTGPLVGAMIAWAATQPKWLAMAALIALGFGMAFPYIVLTARPAWLEKIPSSGPGSELVKQVMGILLIAVAVFFVGIAAQSFVVSYV